MRAAGAGTLLAVGILLGLPGARAAAGEAREEHLRTLYVALDCVPYAVVSDLASEAGGGHFPGFFGPAVMVSSFPSTTSVALGGLLAPLGISGSPGYEARFFDWGERRVRGGGPFSYFRIEFPWRSFFDWGKRGPVASAFGALRPVKAASRGLEKALDAFVRSPQDTFMIYIGDTDAAAHLKGPESLRAVFLDLERLLERARERSPGRPFRTILFSDHGVAGGEPLVNLWRPLRQRLRAEGLAVRKRLTGSPDDVALTPFGLVSSFEVYVQPGREAAVQEVVTAVEGVDLCVRRIAGTDELVVASRAGRARVVRARAGEEISWSYRPEGGDPLGYGPVAERLAAAAGGPAEGFFPSDAWFEATWNHVYPDALHRLFRAFDLVANPASLVCSAAPGFMFGARGTERTARLTMGRLRWTHGALHAGASNGFLLTDDPGWGEPPAVRFDRALAPFAPAADVGGAGATAGHSEESFRGHGENR